MFLSTERNRALDMSVQRYSSKSSFVVLAGLSLLIAGCGSSSETSSSTETAPSSASSPTSSPGSTVVIDGKSFTCAQVVGATDGCGPRTQQVFDEYKEHLDSFVRSGKLGPLNDSNTYRYEDVAFAGLVACTFADPNKPNEQAYIDYMRQDASGTYKDLSGVELLPSWFGASKYLCAPRFGLTFLETDFKSRDLIIP